MDVTNNDDNAAQIKTSNEVTHNITSGSNVRITLSLRDTITNAEATHFINKTIKLPPQGPNIIAALADQQTLRGVVLVSYVPPPPGAQK